KFGRCCVIRPAQLLYQLFHNLGIPQVAETPEELPAGFLHSFPPRIWINRHYAIRNRTAAAQGYTQIVHGIGGKIQTGTITLFKSAFHPESKASLLLRVRRCGCYRQVDSKIQTNYLFSPEQRLNASSV